MCFRAHVTAARATNQRAALMIVTCRFHRRYMAGNKACRLWANMVRQLKPKMIVPQHGRPFADPDTISAFLDWISNLECGLDLLTQEDYRIPS